MEDKNTKETTFSSTEKDVQAVEKENNAEESTFGDQMGPLWKFWRRRRFIVSILAFFGFFNVYALRVNLSVAIVAMTSNRTVLTANGNETYVSDFDWDRKTQGIILSSFFYGYILTQIPGGWLAAKIGGHRVFCLGIGATGLLTLFTPPIAYSSLEGLIFLRVAEGFFEGVTYPCVHAVWARWAPPLERSRLASFGYSGSYVGTVVSLPLCGIIADKIGWPWIFYVFGAVALIWCFVWLIVVARGPDEDKWISAQELKYIQSSLGEDAKNPKAIVHPWKKFLMSLPVWSIVVAHFCENWGFYTMLTQLPTFMKDTLQFDIKSAGFLSALPYLVMAIVLQFAGHIADGLLTRKLMNTTQVRKLFNCTAFLSQTVFMILAAFILTPSGVVTCLTIAVGFGAFAWTGFSVNHLDIAPQHASVLMGLSNTFGTIPGMISPLIAGYIVQNKSKSEWQIVFYIASALYFGGAIFYAIFASGERQEWAKDKPDVEDVQISKLQHAYENEALEMDGFNERHGKI